MGASNNKNIRHALVTNGTFLNSILCLLLLDVHGEGMLKTIILNIVQLCISTHNNIIGIVGILV